MTVEEIIIATLVVLALTFAVAAAVALDWAFRSRQFENSERAARSIFDADEPVGVPTDRVLDA